MSEPTTQATPAPAAAPAAEPSKTPAPAAETKAPLSKKEARAALAGELRERLQRERAAEAAGDDAPAPAAKVADKPEDKRAASTEAKIAKLEDKIEDKGGDVPDQKRGESDKDYELRLSKTLGELERTKKEAARAKAEAEKSTAEAKKLQKILEDGKANPLKILKHFGITFEDFAKGIAGDKYVEEKDQLQLPPEILEKIERLEKADKEREAEAARAKAAVQRSADEKVVKAYLEKNSDEYPMAASAPWAVNHIIDATYAAEINDIIPALKALEAGLAENAIHLVKNEKSFKAMAKKDPELKKSLAKWLELQEAAAEARDEDDSPKSLGSLSPDKPARSSKMSKADLKAALAAELKERNRKAREEDDD